VRLSRVFCDLPLAGGHEIILPGTASSHVARVLRLRAGATVVVFDGSGREYEGEIVAIGSARVRVRLGAARHVENESPLRVSLVQAVSRGERMDFTLQKATELGVAAIVPVISARTVVRLDERQAASRLRHWQAIVVSACEQCGRSVIPPVRAPLALERYLAEPANAALRLVPSPGAAESLGTLAPQPSAVELLIGPEGGFEEGELAAAVRSGFKPVRLGPRILRTETAGLAAIAALQARWGDLG
jgi:16S rRNA (uracil1498-N3)-methyltransferase